MKKYILALASFSIVLLCPNQLMSMHFPDQEQDEEQGQLQPNEQLLEAAYAGDTQAVAEALAQGADVNYPDDSGETALIYASDGGHEEIVRVLIARGADVNHIDNRGFTVLMGAASFGHIEVARMLIEAGAEVNRADNKGDTALTLAAEALLLHGEMDMIELLVRCGSNVNSADHKGTTALMHAIGCSEFYSVREDRIDIVRLLIGAGADVNHADKNGNTALSWAARNESLDIIKLLLLNNARVPGQKSDCILKLLQKNLSPLAIAIITGNRDAITSILEERPTKKAKYEGPQPSHILNLQDGFGMTALQWAAARNDGQTVNELLEREVNVRDQDGNTPLHYAARNGNNSILTALLARRANINTINNNGDTPLHFAARAGHLDAVQTLLNYNARTNLFNRQRALACTLATQNNHPEVAHLLSQYLGQAVFARISRAGGQGQFEWAPTAVLLPSQIAVLVAQYVGAPGGTAG